MAELLVVMGVVALLVVLMVPAMAGTADRSKRAKCQSNLRQIGLGVTMYAGNNNGKVFACFSTPGPTFRQVTLGLSAGSSANSVGLSPETNSVWTCPNRPGLPAFNPTSGYTLGYQYFGGISRWGNPAGFFTSRSPVNLTIARPHWAIAADTVMNSAGGWGNPPAHGTGDTALPQGGNQVFVDGSVQWIQAEEMFFLSSWSLSTEMYWYQDPTDLDVTLKSALPALRFRPRTHHCVAIASDWLLVRHASHRGRFSQPPHQVRRPLSAQG